MLFDVRMPVCACFFVHENTPVSPHVCVTQTVTKEVLPLPPSKNPWTSWYNWFSVAVATILAGCQSNWASGRRHPRGPDCTSQAVAAEGTAERVGWLTLAESFRSWTRESTVGGPEPRSQSFAGREERAGATAACLGLRAEASLQHNWLSHPAQWRQKTRLDFQG